MKVDRKVLRRAVDELGFESLLHLMSSWGVSVRGVNDKDEAFRRIWEAGVTPVRLEDILAVLDLEQSLPFTFWRVYTFQRPSGAIRVGTVERRLNREMSRRAEGERAGYFRALSIGNGVICVFYRFEREELVGERGGVRIVRRICHLKSIVGNGLLLVEEDEWLEWVLELLSIALGAELNSVTFPPFLLRELAERNVVRRAVVFLDGQITGAPGLSRVVVEGENVVKGAEKLRSRQELNFWSAGPLLEIETDMFMFSSSGRVKIKDGKGMFGVKEMLRLIEDILKSQENA
ncbi:MAG: hypothetical protein QXX18_04330 [Candidatus Jordarchaeales archaeon]|nr:hypothetical protein [Candidatus Jordarchaeia archaeon]